MIELLRDLVELESPTGDTRAMRDRMAAELDALGAAVTLEGEHVRADFAGDGDPLVLLGHIDTVWPRGTLEVMPWQLVDGRAHGPGAYDMKGGLVVMLGAIRLAQTSRPLRVVLTADEEIGSPTARGVIASAAEGAAAAFVVEPPTGKGNLKTGRKGLGRFRLTVTGQPAHAGDPAAGVSAIHELAVQVLRVHALNDRERGITVNVGVVSGGTRENVVAAHAEALLDVRVARAEDCAHVEQQLQDAGQLVAVSGGWTRPPLEPSAGSAVLVAQAREHGRALGLELREATAPGGSDGNLIGALGVPVLDGLGAEGDGAHAVEEHVLVDSLPVRTRLLAEILRSPGL